MIIDRITLTGADDFVEVNDLGELSLSFPFIEWALLFSPNNGRERYPSQDFIDRMCVEFDNLSAHFCGAYARELTESNDWQRIDCLDDSFKRVQINYNFSHNNKWDMEQLLVNIATRPHLSFILQYNKSNSKVLDSITHLPKNLHFLYDASGGRGEEITKIEPPIHGLYTGYAGGICPENAENIMKSIIDFPNEAKVFIDMESGIRTNNRLDIGKIESILLMHIDLKSKQLF